MNITVTQATIMEELGVEPVIDPREEIESRVGFLMDYIRASKAKGLVLGISGGQDSALAGKLSQMAITRLREEGYPASFLALQLPFRTQKDAEDAQESARWISPDEFHVVNVEYGVKGVADEITYGTPYSLNDYHLGNVKARLRAVTQYALAGTFGLLVVGTDHAAEAVSGFFTKFGDGAADILPLSGLTKRQGKSLLRYLGAPERLYTKAPTADLLSDNPGQRDEDELGITYEQIDDYLEGLEVSPEVRKLIENRYFATQHKRQGPVTPHDNWWKAEVLSPSNPF